MGYTSNNLRLEALSWRAKQLGISYGVFSAQISREEANQVCKEFEQLLAERRKAEEARIQTNKGLSKKRGQQK